MNKLLISTPFLLAGMTCCYASPRLKVEVIGQLGPIGAAVMNKNGVVAVSRFDGEDLWTPETGFRSINRTTANGVTAGLQLLDINEQEQVTGICTIDGPQDIQRAYIASVSAPLVILANHPGSNHGVGMSINNHGTVQGSGARYPDFDGGYINGGVATTWMGPNYSALMSLQSGGQSETFINDQNICLGSGGFIFTPGAQSLTRLQVPSLSGLGFSTKIITDGGRIVGTTTSTTTFETLSRVWSTNGNLLYTSAMAWSIKDANDAADAIIATNGTRSQIWNPIAGTITPVQSLLDENAIADGWQVNIGYNISNAGHILALAKNSSGVDHYVRLSPVPEPATILALSAGMAGILARRRRRSD